MITVSSLVVLIVVGSSRRTTWPAGVRLSYSLYILFLLGIILPFQLGHDPALPAGQRLGLLGTYRAMILFYTGLQLPFTVFLYTGFIRSLPREYADAALDRRRLALAELPPRHLPAAAADHRHGDHPQRRLHLERLLHPAALPRRLADETVPVVVYRSSASTSRTGATSSPRVVLGDAADPGALPAAPAVRDQGLLDRAEGMSMRPVRLRCEHREDVPCIDDARPAAQLGARGRATSARPPTGSLVDDGALWDSGMVASDRSVDIPYAGRELAPASEFIWTVQVWDEAGEPSGLQRAGAVPHGSERVARAVDRPRPRARPGDGRPGERRRAGQAAAPAVELPLPATAVRGHAARCVARPSTRRPAACWRWSSTARASATLSSRPDGPTTARGSSTRRTMSPRSCATARTCSARSSAPAGTPGFVGIEPPATRQPLRQDPALLCELHVEHADGSVEVIASDERLARHHRPARVLGPADRRALRRAPGARAWTPVTVAPRDDAPLVPERSQPMRVTEDLRPVAITERAPGRARLRPRPEHGRPGPPRRRGRARNGVRLRFAEMLEPDGSSHLENLRTARQHDTYVLRGGGDEVYEPRFTFHGFRYVEVTGLADEPARDDHRPRRALRHAAQRLVRMLRRARQPALAQHQLGPARQLHLRPDRLPAARRAARLARRCPGLPPHRRAEHGRRRLRHQVGR